TALEGRTYIYVVQAYSGADGYSAYSNEYTISIPPAKPTNLTATAVLGGIALTWTNHSASATSIRIVRADGSDSGIIAASTIELVLVSSAELAPGGTELVPLAGPPETIATIPPTVNTYLDTKAEAGETYTYTVIAESDAMGVFSNPATATMLNDYTVTFKYNNSQSDWVQTVTSGEKADYPIEDPIREGFVFAGWYKDAGFVSAYDFNAPVTASITLYAKWTAVAVPTYEVTVNSGTGGGSYAAGEKVDITADAAPAGKTFDRWTTTSGVIFAAATNETTSFVMPSSAVTVTATYKDLPPSIFDVTITGNGNGIAIASPSSATAGTIIVLTATPDNGYTFKEWQVVSGGVTISNNSFTMPAMNVSIKVVFEKSSTTDPDDPNGNGNNSDNPEKTGGPVWPWVLLSILGLGIIGGVVAFFLVRRQEDLQSARARARARALSEEE
ncbi:MAG: InlB B-repeat-containing protein, partial [Coriobacteriia bacterium]|nr:InlB B-repeat-containing protein [Coriobacteriia bacterium]